MAPSNLDPNTTIFRCPWSNTPVQHTASSEPISPLTIAYHTVRVSTNGSISNIDTLSGDPPSTTPVDTRSSNCEEDLPAATGTHKARINSIRWLLSTPDGVRRASSAYISQGVHAEPVLHLQHRMSVSSMNVEPSGTTAEARDAHFRGSASSSDPEMSVEPKSDETSSEGTYVTAPSHMTSAYERNILLFPDHSVLTEPQTITAMDLISQIHDICVRATRTYLLSQMVSAYMRDPHTTSPYSHRRSLSPNRLPPSSSSSSSGTPAARRPASRQERYRQRENIPRGHRSSSSASRPNVSWNLSTNVSLMCTLAWTHAGRARLSDSRAEMVAVSNMAALLEWGDKIVGAEQEIWNRRKVMDDNVSKRLARQHVEDDEMDIVEDLGTRVREMEWMVVVGVAAAAVNICLYMDNRQAKCAIETLLMG